MAWMEMMLSKPRLLQRHIWPGSSTTAAVSLVLSKGWCFLKGLCLFDSVLKKCFGVSVVFILYFFPSFLFNCHIRILAAMCDTLSYLLRRVLVARQLRWQRHLFFFFSEYQLFPARLWKPSQSTFCCWQFRSFFSPRGDKWRCRSCLSKLEPRFTAGGRWRFKDLGPDLESKSLLCGHGCAELIIVLISHLILCLLMRLTLSMFI